MKSKNFKQFIGLVAGVLFLAGVAAAPFIAQAAAQPEATNNPPGHHFQVDPDKAAQRLADNFGVSKDEVLKYQQQGVNFRDLSKASLLAKASGKSLAEIMAAKTTANTWKDVAQSLGVTKEKMQAVRQDIAASRLESKLGIPKQSSLELLQQGYHLRDIAVANKLAANTGKSVTDVLALKKINNRWSDVAQTLGVDDNTFRQDMKDLRGAFPHRGMPGHHPMKQAS